MVVRGRLGRRRALRVGRRAGVRGRDGYGHVRTDADHLGLWRYPPRPRHLPCAARHAHTRLGHAHARLAFRGLVRPGAHAQRGRPRRHGHGLRRHPPPRPPSCPTVPRTAAANSIRPVVRCPARSRRRRQREAGAGAYSPKSTIVYIEALPIAPVTASSAGRATRPRSPPRPAPRSKWTAPNTCAPNSPKPSASTMPQIVGSGTVACNLEYGKTYPRGTQVTFTATPEEGWEFDTWSCVGLDSASDTLLSGGVHLLSRTLAAYTRPTIEFAQTPHSVNITIDPPEAGSVMIWPQSGMATEGQTLVLVARPNDNFAFIRWSSDSGLTFTERESGTSSSFIMPNHDCEIRAEFAPFNFERNLYSDSDCFVINVFNELVQNLSIKVMGNDDILAYTVPWSDFWSDSDYAGCTVPYCWMRGPKYFKYFSEGYKTWIYYDIYMFWSQMANFPEKLVPQCMGNFSTDRIRGYPGACSYMCSYTPQAPSTYRLTTPLLFRSISTGESIPIEFKDIAGSDWVITTVRVTRSDTTGEGTLHSSEIEEPTYKHFNGLCHLAFSGFMTTEGCACLCGGDYCIAHKIYVLDKIYLRDPILKDTVVTAEEFCPFTNVVTLTEEDISDYDITDIPTQFGAVPLPHSPRATSYVNHGYGEMLTFRLSESADISISVKCEDTGTACQRFSRSNVAASARNEKYAYVWSGKGCCDGIPECNCVYSSGCDIAYDGGDLDTVAKEGNYKFVITASAPMPPSIGLEQFGFRCQPWFCDKTDTQEIDFKVKYDFENRETKNSDAQEFIILNDDEFSDDE